MPRVLSAAVVIALTTMLVSAMPHQQTAGRPMLSVETDLVLLPITVLDGQGRFVTGLTQGQFTVYDNGERQPIQFFTSEDLPATVGLLIDSSSSMRGKRADVTAAAGAFAAISHPRDELFTINFNERVWPGLPASIAFTSSAEQLREALTAAPVQGRTALYDAIERALDHLALGTLERKALIIVSDGGDNASVQTLDAVLTQARRTSAAIYSVVLYDPNDHEARPGLLRKLAGETGGTAFTPRRSGDVATAFASIAREIRSGYTIGFVPPDAPDGSYRTIRVVANTPDRRQLTVRTRAGYYAKRLASAGP
jgi:Ca-activated chloride channel homolog